MSEKLYYDNPYNVQFDARVVSMHETEAGVELVLDRTAFYPEGGGQPADHGTIAGYAVVDVRKDGDDVVHILRAPQKERPDEGALSPGALVDGTIDWNRRHDYMQQHTGQHVISAAMIAVGEYNTVSVHQGEGYTTVEIGSEEMAPGDLQKVETLANRVIREDRPVTDIWVTDEEIHRYPLRRPPKVSGSIRLVMIEDFDCVACGGVHARRTAEVGLVKCIGMEKIRGNVRTVWKIGDRAYDDYAQKHDAVATLCRNLSSQPPEIVERVEQLQAQVNDLKREQAEYKSRIAGLVAEELDLSHRSDGKPGTVTRRFDAEDKDLFRTVAENLVSRGGAPFCLVNVSQNQIQWIIGEPGSPPGAVDFNRIRSELLPLISGKGGGRPPLWQGAGAAGEGTEDADAAADAFLGAFERMFID